MGCDIHAMIEKKAIDKNDGKLWSWWVNGGDPEISRNYVIFSVLGDVRNEDGIPFIAKDRGIPEDSCSAMKAWSEQWEGDAHSQSWVTLAEMKAFDVHQKYNCTRWVRRDDLGKMIETFASSSDRSAMTEQRGMIEIFEEFPGGVKQWQDLITSLEKVKTPSHSDNDVRLVFFFDN